MTETEQEPVQAPEEPVEGDEGEEEQVPLEEPAEPAEDEPEAFAAPAGARDDLEVDAVYAKLATKAKNYAKGVTELDGIENMPLQVCELCSDAYPGFRWAQPRTDEAASAVNAFHGTMELDSLKQAEWAIRCTGCEGRGWVKTSSLVQGNEAIVCRKCNGSGYTVLEQDTGMMKPPESVNGEVVGPAQVGVNPDDPRIQALNAEGFMVVKVPTIAGQ